MEEFLIQGGREQQNLITCHPYASDGKHRKNTFHKPDDIAHPALFTPIKKETICKAGPSIVPRFHSELPEITIRRLTVQGDTHIFEKSRNRVLTNRGKVL